LVDDESRDSGDENDRPSWPFAFGFGMLDPATFDPATFDLSKLDLSQLDLSGVDLGAMLSQLGSAGPVNWDMARQVAAMIANEDPTAGPLTIFAMPGSAAPVRSTADPSDAVGTAARTDSPSSTDAAELAELSELVRAAEILVGQSTDLSGPSVEARLVTRAQWADEVLLGLHPVVERLAQLLRSGATGDDTGIETTPDFSDLDPLALIGGLMPVLAPMLVGVQAGFMAGHLARIALTRHDLPLPLTGPPTVLLVAENANDFERDWGLDRRDFRFTLALHEITHAQLRSIPWLRDRIVALAAEYVGGYRIDTQAIEGRLGAIDPTDPSSFEEVLGNPDALLGAMTTTEQDETRLRLQTLISVIEGLADHVVESIGTPMIPTLGIIQEARKRHRVVQGEAERFIAKLLGMEMRREHYDRGRAFCEGVVERAGETALHRLWERPEHLPTPTELDAPGLWLARLEIMDGEDPGGSGR
jgi:putative hydrolase